MVRRFSLSYSGIIKMFLLDKDSYYRNLRLNNSMTALQPITSYSQTNAGNTDFRLMGLDPCDGFQKLLLDLGMLGLLLGTISGMMGIFTMSLSFVTQFQANMSAYLIGIPTSMLALLGPRAPKDLVALWTSLGLLDVFGLLNFFAPLGDFINMTDVISNTINLISLSLSAVSAFPDVAIDLINYTLGTSFSETTFSSYRCQPKLGRGDYMNTQMYGWKS